MIISRVILMAIILAITSCDDEDDPSQQVEEYVLIAKYNGTCQNNVGPLNGPNPVQITDDGPKYDVTLKRCCGSFKRQHCSVVISVLPKTPNL